MNYELNSLRKTPLIKKAYKKKRGTYLSIYSSFCQSGRQDSNLRPPGPKPGALPGCATPRDQPISELRVQRYVFFLKRANFIAIIF